MKQTAKKGPAKRETRGILKVKKVKGKAKKVRFKKKGVMKRHEQVEQLYDPDERYRRQPAGPLTQEQARARMVGSRGDPQGTQFRLTAAGNLIPVRPWENHDSVNEQVQVSACGRGRSNKVFKG